MIVKLQTGSRLLLNDKELSGDIDYNIIIDSKTYTDSETQQYALQKRQSRTKTPNEDNFIIDISKEFHQLFSSEKEPLFYFLLNNLIHKKLGIPLDQEEFYQDYVQEMNQHLKVIFDTIIIGIRGKVKHMKWFWWYWSAIKVLRNEWADVTVAELQEVFANSRAKTLTETQLNYTNDYLVEEVLLKSPILSETINLFKWQSEMIESYNERHDLTR